MAKKRKSSGGKKRRGGGGRRRKSGAAGWGLDKTGVMIAGATALGYGFAAAKAEKAKGDEMKWFKDPPLLMTPVGRAGTGAIIAGGLAYMNIGRKYAKPIAYGLGAVALLGIGRRNLKLYETEAEAKGLMTAGADGAGEGRKYLEGTLDAYGGDSPTARTNGYDGPADWQAQLEAARNEGRAAGYYEGTHAGYAAGAHAGAQAAAQIERSADSATPDNVVQMPQTEAATA